MTVPERPAVPYDDRWECPDCGARLARGNNSPAQVEAQMRRHARTDKHYRAVQVNLAWQSKQGKWA